MRLANLVEIFDCMRALCCVIFCVLMSSGSALAQQRHWVFFSDKEGVAFDPHAYFHHNALVNRVTAGFPIDHITDRPLRTDYVQAVAVLADSIKHQSRWFNALTCYASADALAQIQALPFVDSIQPVGGYMTMAMLKDTVPEVDKEEAIKNTQLTRMGGEQFHEANLTGKGVRIAILDAGFRHVDEYSQFDHINIAGTYDFIKDKDFVYSFHDHGMHVLSCIGGMDDGIPLGLAYDASFFLARTENVREFKGEEDNWLAAIEWADKNGVDIVNSSLGYTVQRYFKEDMNGREAIVTRAGNLAARKGLLIVNSAGNEGGLNWRIIAAPADADSVLAVGGIGPYSGVSTSFSSQGPTSDGRLKPNVSAFGYAAVPGKRGLHVTAGTSFASPFVAGFAACVKQHTGKSGMELFKTIEAAGDLYPYADYAHGYGVPRAENILTPHGVDTTFDLEVDLKEITVTFRDSFFVKPDSAIRKVDESSGDSIYVSRPAYYYYYHYEDEEGFIFTYHVMVTDSERITMKNPLRGMKDRYPIFKAHYRGFTYILDMREALKEEEEEKE